MAANQTKREGDQQQKNQPEKQANPGQPSESRYNQRENMPPDLQDDGEGADSDKRTGTSVSGNTANDRFNATAEQQQTDRDKNAEG